MKASFIPGDLHLVEDPDGSHVISIRGNQVFRTRSPRAAAAKFNELRRTMERDYPVAAATPEETAATFRRATLDAMLGHNSLGGRKKRTTAKGTRTFGG